ncbi:MAG: SWIM zinc finger family protein [Ignavibacteriales bacterium]|nr:SWIM zinc finger family protein [Ignavibacteriales bacterium]
MINEKIILKLTNPASFERGYKYYQKGRVTAYKNENNIISATVIGTDNYESLIDLSNLKAECDCPAYSNNLLCKHLVALLFTYMSGEIKSKSLPKIKGKIKQPEGDNDKDLSQILYKFSKEEIVYHLKRIDADYGIIADYFDRLLLSEKSIDYSMMRKAIRSKVNYFSKHGYINNYFRKMMEAQYDILSLTDSLPNSKASSEFLLETAYWINEKLDVIDDSDGIFSTLVELLIERAAVFLNSASVTDMELFYSYMGKESFSDFNLEVLEIILLKVSNKEILDELEFRLDMTIHRKDPGFAFTREDGLTVYSEYLLKNKPEKFEEYLSDLLEVSFSIKLNYIRFLFNNKRYEEVIELAKPHIPNFHLDMQYEKSLMVLDKTELLIEYYTIDNTKIFSLEKFKKLYQLCKIKRPDLLEKVRTDALNNHNVSINTRIDLLLNLDMIDEVAQLISKLNKTGFELSRDFLENTVAKLCIVKQDAAIAVARVLVNQELKAIYQSNYYERLIEYIEFLILLEDKDYVETIYNTIKVHYKTKKKLLERLNLQPNTNEIINEQELLQLGE